MSYDVLDENGVSDYVDIGPVTASLLSSDNPADYSPITPDGVVTEDITGAGGLGGFVTYNLNFASVPEPVSTTVARPL